MGVDLCCDSKLDSYKTSLNHRLPFKMEAIKKKMQSMKLDKDNAMDQADACEQKAKDANIRAEKAEEEVRDLQKKMQQLESDLDVTQEKLLSANQKLEEKEKALLNAEGEVAALNRRIQMLEEDLEKSEERLLIATQKLDQASTAADDNQRMCKVLENKS